ncbi:MAG: hypothetical protein ACRDP6_09065 [Actinoallomurus sp.]
MESDDRDWQKLIRDAQPLFDALRDLDDQAWQRRAEVPPDEGPEWGLTPQEAAEFPVGSLVRIVEGGHTLGTAHEGREPFRDGEEAIVTEARLTPLGFVWISVRTQDGRTRMGSRGTFEPLGWGN